MFRFEKAEWSCRTVLAQDELGALGTDLAEMDQVSYFSMRGEKREKVGQDVILRLPQSQRNAQVFCRIGAGRDGMIDSARLAPSLHRKLMCAFILFPSIQPPSSLFDDL